MLFQFSVYIPRSACTVNGVNAAYAAYAAYDVNFIDDFWRCGVYFFVFRG